MKQESALSSVLSALYISLVFYILENHLEILKILISVLSFVDDSLFVAQSKSLTILNSFLFCSYNIISSLLEKFGLILEYGKTEIFHFSRSQEVLNPPPLDLSMLEGSSLLLKDIWRYLDFIFDRKLLFHQHIDFYVNKVIPTVKYMKILRNSM